VSRRPQWIGRRRNSRSDAPPAVYLRREFSLEAAPEAAWLLISALGIFDAWINGSRVGDDVLAPGWTDYRRRVDFLNYDVAHLLRAGKNVVEIVLGDGWFSGILSEPQFNLRYGRDPSLFAELCVHDGAREWSLVTDKNWSASTDGPIRENALYHGETFDARIEPRDWRPAEVFPAPKIELCEKPCAPIRRMEERVPVAITEPRPGVFIFDFGENIVGWTRLRISAKRGTAVRLRFGEMLEADGSLHTANLRSARATDRYICAGDGVEMWEPRFTFHGFRYVEATVGSEGTELRDSAKRCLPSRNLEKFRNSVLDLTAIIVHSALPDTGAFECSDPLVNRLQHCIVRGQKGNFLDLPTDCPQRDERLGWSGDAQIFAPTALYNMDASPLFAQWMRAMRDGQREDGAFPDLAPHIILGHGNAGWGDAGIIVPWTVWQFTGDTQILSDNYHAMSRHLRFLQKTSRKLLRPDTLFGDWLAVDAASPEHTPTPKDMIGTAYFARCAKLMGEIASTLGATRSPASLGADAARYADLFEKIRAAFQREYITPNGRVLGDTQTAYLIALGFDLVPEKLRAAAIDRLVELIRARDWHLTTGFLGTPLLAPVLTTCGRTDVAYRLLKQETYPSWLYPVLNGATTMWERWNSWTKERGFGDAGMNSFNHYAYGAIGEWLYATVAGISPAAPGFSRIRIAPIPGGGLTWARAELRTPHGLARSSWRRKGRRFTLDVLVPAGATADIVLPDKTRRTVKAGAHTFTVTLPPS
jgi:alpha-L-rhamnosidase